MLKILNNDSSGIIEAVNELHNDNIVIFPTETVYGIGANAFSKIAIQKIYQLKKRPINNPLIVHILNWKMGKILTDLSESENLIVNEIIKLWPGPLTILVKASKYVIPELNNNSGLIGLRCPSHTIARTLISKSNVPIAAPSANISGKTSSTCLDHINNHFENNTNVKVIPDSKPCHYGVESTIIKIIDKSISIVRPGIILKSDIQNVINNLNFKVNIKDDIKSITQKDYPGSSITHYSIDKNIKLVNFIETSNLTDITENKKYFNDINKGIDLYLENSIFVDFGCKNLEKKKKFLGYVDLSEKGDCLEALYNLYNILHQLNNLECNNILIFNYFKNKDEYYQILYDRLFRCCSGKEMIIPVII